MSRIVRQQKNAALMAAGVTIEDPATTYIDRDVDDRRRHDHPSRRVARRAHDDRRAAARSTAASRIVDSRLGDRVTILNHCVITDARVADDARVGPFAHLRTGRRRRRRRAQVGNFVELKKTVLGAGSKAMHLAYLGDATIGANVNIGAGTITCNYDGAKKHQTIIEDGAFIGSDTQLVAPVTVGKGAYVGTRHDDPRGRARRRARGQRRQAAEHRRLGRASARRSAKHELRT